MCDPTPDRPENGAACPWPLRHSHKVFSTRWLEVRHDAVIRPDGAEYYYDHVVLPESVTVLALTDQGTVPVTRQWIYTHGERQWRLPAGGVDRSDDSAAAAARRELMEETGLTAGRWRFLGTVSGADSATNHRDHVFAATELVCGNAALEPGETDLEVHWLEFDMLLDLVLNGQVRHAGSAFAVLATALRRKKAASIS